LKITTNTHDILEKLIGFDTTSCNPNQNLMAYVATVLSEHGIESTLIPNVDNSKANLYATVGPQGKPGVMLSGHTDVVPIDGQKWTRPAFSLTYENGRYYGRGTTDMKGFIACALNAMISASERTLSTPLHLALSYDEEIGCVGVHSLLDMLAQSPVKPTMCIVGEPTSLGVATKHKGKTAIEAICTGKEGHSALAPHALNAIHLGCDLVSVLREKQIELVNDYGPLEVDDVPYTTVHVGKFNAGYALNIVPNLCTVNFEIRNRAEDNPVDILSALSLASDNIVATTGAPEAAITFSTTNTYPGLNTPNDAAVVDFVKSLTGANDTTHVAFGTEGGLFSQTLGIPTVVCGPGSMSQGHKPDEYVEEEQLYLCEQMMSRLLDRLV